MEVKTAETMKSLAVTTIRSTRQKVASLSGGQRQSVAVARAVMWNSRLVILDEPTAALGVAQTRQVLELVKRLAEQGLAVVIISHNLHDVFEVADRITVLRLGRSIAVFERDKTTQQEVVHAITAGVADEGRRHRPDDRRRLRSPPPTETGDMTADGRPRPPSPTTSARTATAILARTLGRWWDGVRAGDVGSLPIIVGLLLITVFFQTKNDNFLTAGNFSNLIVQMAGTTTIAMGVVFVLLLGEIDLSIGFVSGIAGVVVAELQVGGNWTVHTRLGRDPRGGPRVRRDRPHPGLVRRLHRRAVVHRHARLPARAAGRDPEADRRDGRDRDPGQDDLQRRQLLPRPISGAGSPAASRSGSIALQHALGRRQPAAPRHPLGQPRPRRDQARAASPERSSSSSSG